MIGAVSVRARVVGGAIVVVVVTLILVNAAVYVTLRRELRSDVAERLDDRLMLATRLAEDFPEEVVFDRLERSGIPARLVRSDGADLETGALRVRAGESFLEAAVPSPDEPGRGVLVYASLTDADRNLRDLLVLQGLGTFFGACLAALLIIRIARSALRPLDVVAETAHAIARGRTGERLRPDRSDTEIGRLAAAFDEMLDAEEAALDRAYESSRFNQRFLSDAAHQLRTPLAGIRASAELLLMSPTDDERDRLLGNLVRSSERVSLLIAALLRMARLDQGGLPDGRPTDLAELCREEVEHVRTHSGDVEFAVDDPGPYVAIVDRPSMREALGNLFDNALRHALSRVDVRLSATNSTITITVVDDGPGMDDATAERAFERFATFTAEHGAGLGLPIARGIVEAHGGTLVYEDKAFVIRLPADPSVQS